MVSSYKPKAERQDLAGINRLFDQVMAAHGLKNDAQLCFFLQVHPPVISKQRHGQIPVGDSMVLRLHERGGLAVKHIRKELEGRA